MVAPTTVGIRAIVPREADDDDDDDDDEAPSFCGVEDEPVPTRAHTGGLVPTGSHTGDLVPTGARTDDLEGDEVGIWVNGQAVASDNSQDGVVSAMSSWELKRAPSSHVKSV
mmetsp:Transcript_22152/g.44941  ORF Transcript_22152/g.44941 Transcript_22152/m.44941 type:complete len:112 (+) Transcript_22152:162-497(+)